MLCKRKNRQISLKIQILQIKMKFSYHNFLKFLLKHLFLLFYFSQFLSYFDIDL